MGPPLIPPSWRDPLRKAFDANPMVQAVRRHPRLAVYLLSIALHLALAPFVVHDWDGYVFTRTTRDFLAGITPYETVEEAPPRIYVGEGVPVVNSWYAYPPLPLLLWTPFYALLTAVSPLPTVERLAIKLPMILGNLLLAFLAGLLVRDVLRERGHPRAEAVGETTERLLLLNPLLIFMAGVWGMFDAWILVFLLAGILTWRRGQTVLAGVAFGLSALVKLFPIFLGPAFLAYALRTRGWRAALAAGAGGAGVVLLLSLPFYVGAPSGFLEQVVGMHGKRPPQGFTLVGIPIGFEWTNNLLGLRLLPEGFTPEAASQVSFFLLATLLAVLYLRVGAIRDEATLLRTGLLAILIVLLTGKVVNEQYFLLPTVLATLAFALTGEAALRDVARAYTWGGFLAALIAGWHLLTFIPPDTAVRLPFDVAQVLPQLRRATGLTEFHLYLLPSLLSAAALVPALLRSVRLVLPALAEPLSGLARRLPPGPGRRATALLLAVVILLPVAAGVWTAPSATATAGGAARDEGPFVVMRYDLGWINPAHDPAVRWGTWNRGLPDEPVLGFYSQTSGKIDHDFRAFAQAGVDVVLFDAWYHVGAKLPALSRLAREHGLAVAPSINLTELALHEGQRALGPDGRPVGPSLSMRAGTRASIAGLVEFFLDPLAAGGQCWRLGGRPVVVLHGTSLLRHDAAGAERERLVDLAVQLATGRPDLAPQPVERAMVNHFFPNSGEELAAGHPWAALWRETLAEARLAFWQDLRRELEARHGPLVLVATDAWGADPPGHSLTDAVEALAVFDTSYEPPPGAARRRDPSANGAEAWAQWATRSAVQAAHLRGADRPVFVPVFPGYDDRPYHRGEGVEFPYGPPTDLTYDRSWAAALALRPDAYILHSWNEYDEGLVLEPSRSRGDAMAEATAQWIVGMRNATALPAREVLLVSDMGGARRVRGVGDPDWTYGLGISLSLLAFPMWGTAYDAAEWNRPQLSVNLSRYNFIVVDAGPGVARTSTASAFVAALEERVRAGATVLILGGGTGPFQDLADWQEGAPLGGTTRLLAPQGPIALDANDRTRVQVPPPGAEVLLRMRNDTLELPALWRIPMGNGTLAVTAFRPQGTDEIGSRELQAMRTVVEAML